ncbi:MAG: LamG-like jellyroll fold domain-containing protein [Bacteroidota bacterium]
MKRAAIYLFILLAFGSAAIAQGPGTALRFDGSSTYASGGNQNFGFGSTLSVSAWVKWNQTPTTGVASATIMALNSSTGNGTDGQFWLQHNSGNTAFQIAVRTNSGRRIVSGTTAPVDGAWYHVAGVFNGTQLRIYVNGVQEGLDTLSGTIVSLSASDIFSIGQWSNATGSFRRINADIDEARVWTTALSSTEIRDNMCRHLPASVSGLAGYWRFDTGSGSTAADYSVNGRTLTLSTPAPGWQCSSAPIGNESSYSYTSSWNNEEVFLYHSAGDYVRLDDFSGSLSGVHIYRIDGVASDTTLPVNVSAISSLRHWGVFVVNGAANVSFRTRYYYWDSNDEGHPGIFSENQLRLAVRQNDCSSWSRDNNSPSGNRIQLTSPFALPQFQLILCSITTANTLDFPTYTWIGGNSSWTTNSNWSPSRSSRSSDDILVFNNYNNSAVTVTSLRQETIGKLRIENGAQVTIQASDDRNLTLSGAPLSGLVIASGASLTLGGSKDIELRLPTDATAQIWGALITTGSGKHALNATSASSVDIYSGAVLRQESSGYFFTSSGTAGVAIFHSGSRFEFRSTQGDARPPFGLSAPNSKVVFETGSTYAQQSNVTRTFELSGRSYANVEISNNTNYSVSESFSGTAIIDTLNIVSGSTLQFSSNSSGSGSLNIFGDLIVDGSLQYSTSSGVRHTLRFGGSVVQKIRGTGTITLPSNLTGLLIDAPDVRLARDLSVDAPILLNSGAFKIMSNTLTVNGTLSQAGGSLAGDSTSTLVFAGSSSAITCPPITVGNLVADRAATVSLGGTVQVETMLTLTRGTLSIGSDTLILNGAISQTAGTLLGGNSSNMVLGGTVSATLPALTLGSLRINKSGGAILAGTLDVYSNLDFHNGIIDIADQIVNLQGAMIVGGSPSAASMIATDGTGVVRRFWSADGSFTFPLGDKTGTAEYSPLTATLAGGSYAAGAYVDASVKNSRHPSHTDPSNYLKRYWQTSSSGITNATAAVAATYTNSDIIGVERRISSAAWGGSSWSYFGRADSVNNQVNFTGLTTLLMSYTGKDEFPFLVISNADGSWQNSDTWDIGRVPLSSDSVIVRHFVTLASSASCAGLFIDSPGVLSNSGSSAPLSIYGGWTNDGSFIPSTFVPVSLFGRADTVFGIAGNAPTTFADLTLNASYALLQDIECTGLFSISVGSTCSAGSAQLTLKAAPTALFIAGRWDPEIGMVHFAADAPQDIPTISYYDLKTSSGSGVQLRTLLGDITVGNALTLATGAQLALSNYRVDLKGFEPFILAGGWLDYGTSTIAYSSPDSQQITGTEYYNLLISAEGGSAVPPVGKGVLGSITTYGDLFIDSLVSVDAANTTINVQRNLYQRGNEVGTMPTRAGRIVWGSSGTLRFFGSGNSMLEPNNSGQFPDIRNLLLEKSGIADTVFVAEASGPASLLRIAADANFSISSGVLDYREVTFFPEQLELGSLTLSSGAAIRAAGLNNFPLHLSSGIARFASNTFQSGSRVELYGDNQDIPGADHNINSYSTLLLTGTGSKSLTADIAVADSLILTSGTTISSAAHTLVYSFGATLKYALASDSIPSRQTAQTTGEEYQSTFGPTNLVVSNRKTLSLGAAHSLSGALTLEAGHLLLGDYNLSLGSTASIAGEDLTRFIVTNGNGALRRDGISTSQVFFPIGTIDAITSDTTFNPVTISNSGTADAFAVRVQPSIDNPPMFTDVVVNRQWNIEEGTAGGSNAALMFQWNTAEQGASFDPWGSVVINYYTTTWTEESAFVSGSGPYSALAAFTTISKYFVSMATPLPVELLTFGGKRSGSEVNLSWSTATELFNLGFEVQRSIDGIHWDVAGFVDGNGTTSSPRDYQFAETLSGSEAMAEVLQYRLKQLDADGTYSFSWTLRLTRKIEEEQYLLQSYPQPMHQQGLITFRIPNDMPVRLEVFDSMGRRIATLADGTQFTAGTHVLPLDMALLPAGVYFCVMHTALAVSTHRVLLTR